MCWSPPDSCARPTSRPWAKPPTTALLVGARSQPGGSTRTLVLVFYFFNRINNRAVAVFDHCHCAVGKF